MGILKNLAGSWKSKSTTDKISMVLEFITMIGGGLIGSMNGKIYSQNMKPLAGFCVRLTMTGMGMATGEVAGQQLRKNYAEPLGKLIDYAGTKMKEDSTDEQHA